MARAGERLEAGGNRPAAGITVESQTFASNRGNSGPVDGDHGWLASAAGVTTALSTGTEKRNVAPSPGVLSIQIRPPCASTIPIAIDKPRPVPRLFAVRRECQ
jgi:hypothetical protein